MTTINRPVATERARGRPADLESGELQTQLMDAAENLFAEYGYAATSVRKLAETAGVNPALVHYYFGTKRKLLLAVLDRALEPMAEAIASMRNTGSVRVTEVAGLMFNMVSRHPALPRLITREVMLSGGEMQAFFAEHYAPRLGGALPGMFEKAREQGRIGPQFDPGASALMLLSLCMFPFIARSIAEPVLGIEYTEKGLHAYLEQLNLLISQGMTSGGTPS